MQAANPVGKRRRVEFDPLAGVGLALPVQRQVLAKLRLEDHRQQLGAGAAARDRVKRRWWLADRLASTAGEPLAHRLDHLPLPRDHLQRLGDVLAQLGQLAVAARAGGRPGDHHPLARQMRRQWPPHRLATDAGASGLLLCIRLTARAEGRLRPRPRWSPTPRVAAPADRAACGRARTRRRTARAEAWLSGDRVNPSGGDTRNPSTLRSRERQDDGAVWCFFRSARMGGGR